MPSSQNKQKKRIGLFGGSFDPPHRGHRKALSAFLREAELDLVFVVPSGISPSPGKGNVSGFATPTQRLEMARLAFTPVSEKVRILDWEIRAEGVSYTYLTVARIRREYPDSELYLLIGTDQFLRFDQTWRRADEIMRTCTLCVMDRDGEEGETLKQKKRDLEKIGARCLLLKEKAYIISSSEIRRQLQKVEYSAALVPAVHEYITLHGVYQKQSRQKRELLCRLKKELSRERLSHVLSVERETALLCRLFAYPKSQELRTAALYHDLTKEKSVSEQLDVMDRFGYIPSDFDLAAPAILHGRTAALLAAHEGLSDFACHAVSVHTTGCANMSLADKILYFADVIEETRTHPACQKARSDFYNYLPDGLAERKVFLDRSIIRQMEDMFASLRSAGRPVHPDGIAALEDLKRKGKLPMNQLEKATFIAGVLDEKKATDVSVLHIASETVIADYFVIATATSSTHLNSLCDEVEYRMSKQDQISPSHIEGKGNAGWILMDYGDVIVHLFDKASREFFKLEKLWNRAVPVEFDKQQD